MGCCIIHTFKTFFSRMNSWNYRRYPNPNLVPIPNPNPNSNTMIGKVVKEVVKGVASAATSSGLNPLEVVGIIAIVLVAMAFILGLFYICINRKLLNVLVHSVKIISDWPNTTLSNIERTQTPYFWLGTNEHRTLNLIGISLNLLNHTSNSFEHHVFEH